MRPSRDRRFLAGKSVQVLQGVSDVFRVQFGVAEGVVGDVQVYWFREGFLGEEFADVGSHLI